MVSEENNLVCANVMRLLAAGAADCMVTLRSQLTGSQQMVAAEAARGGTEARCGTAPTGCGAERSAVCLLIAETGRGGRVKTV
jgi:hypothetical protein